LKLHVANTGANNAFTGYGPEHVAINGTRYTQSLIVTPGRIINDWCVGAFAALTAQDLTPVLALHPAVFILGTGPKLRFPSAEILRPLAQAQIGWEIMDTPAACRTYNILMQEGRNVACAILLE
jgi:uncharacterized protein